MSRQANVATPEAAEAEAVKKFNIAANVSQNFQDAVRKAAKDANYTVSTWLQYHIDKKLGRNPERPDTDADYENISISTAVPQETKDAIKAALAENQSQADFIREVAAAAAGYDLALEPERLPTGEAMRKRQVVISNKNQVLMDLWETDPNMIATMLLRRQKAWSEIGLTTDQVQAALKSGTLDEDNYTQVEQLVASTAEAPAPTPEPATV